MVSAGPLVTRHFPRLALQADTALEDALASDDEVDNAAPAPLGCLVTPRADSEEHDYSFQDVHFEARPITYQQWKIL